MLGQLRNEIGKRAVASSCDAAADEELVAAAKKGMNWVLKVSPSVISFNRKELRKFSEEKV